MGLQLLNLFHYRNSSKKKLLEYRKTKLIFCESIGNPAVNVTDIEKISNLAHKHNIPLFIDNTVQNGRTYYYAIVAYDYGAPDIGPGISPSENTTVIDIDEYDNIRGIGKNVAIVTPQTSPAGYADPDILIDSLNTNLIGTGNINPTIVSREQLVPGTEYHITFNFDTIFNENILINYLQNNIQGGYLDFSLQRNSMIISDNVVLLIAISPNISLCSNI